MASDINLVVLEGRIGRDPVLRHTASGTAVCNLRLANSQTRTSKATGEKTDQVEWYNVTVWGKLAETAGKYLEKGSHVIFTGSWDQKDDKDRNGEEIKRHELTAMQMKMLGGGRAKGAEQGNERRDSGQRDQRHSAGAAFEDDDIPF